MNRNITIRLKHPTYLTRSILERISGVSNVKTTLQVTSYKATITADDDAELDAITEEIKKALDVREIVETHSQEG